MKTKFLAVLAALLLASFGANAATISAVGHYAGTTNTVGVPMGNVDLQSPALDWPDYVNNTYYGTPSENVDTLHVTQGGIVSGNSWYYDYTKPQNIGNSEHYLAVFHTNGKATFDLSEGVTEFSFLWGTIDTDNKVSVTNGNDDTYSFTGRDLLLALGFTKPNDISGQKDSYVTITDLAGIKSIVLTAVCETFELARISAVPLPGALALFGTALGGLILRRKSVAAI